MAGAHRRGVALGQADRDLGDRRLVGGAGGLAKQVLEQGAVMDHRLPQVLGRGLVVGRALADAVRGAVVIEDSSVVHGEVGDHLVAALGGVAALLHHGHDQPLRSHHGFLWRVDELLLDRRPVLLVAGSRRGI